MWPFNKFPKWRARQIQKTEQLNRAAELETKLDNHKKEMMEFLRQEQEKYRRRLEALDFKTELRQRRL